MDCLLFEKIKNSKYFNHNLLDSTKIDYISFDFRIKNNVEGVLLLILNLALLEKLLSTSFIFHKQKKNIRSFAPVGNVIGGRFFIRGGDFMNHFVNFWWSKKNFYLKDKSHNVYNTSSHFSVNNYLNFNFLKINKNSWETFSYLYEKQTYGLYITIQVPIRYFYYRRLILSMYNLLVFR